jgi:osmotically inducible protein OsmC
MKKTAHVVWKGSIKEGGGLITTETGVLREAPYGFNARFEGGKGTNPEELIAAAHASCFSMALSLALGEAGFPPTRITTDAEITLEKGEGGYAITGSHLTVTAEVPGADAAHFEAIAEKTKLDCPVSRLLRAPITMTAELA